MAQSPGFCKYGVFAFEEQRKHVDELGSLLKQNPNEVSQHSLMRLVQEMAAQCLWYPEKGALKLADWETIGRTLPTEPRASVEVLQDWKQVFRMILTSMQYVVWESEYLRHAQAAALGGGGAYTVEQLFGSGQFAAVPAQTVLPQATLAVVSECAYRAFLKVPQAGEPADCKRALQLFSDQPINLIGDTQYVYLAMQSLRYSYCALHLD
ncbi:hypothetical protein E2320_022926, partial [Naja naja]